MNEELKGILEKAYANGKTIDEVSASLKKNGFGDEDVAFAGSFYNSKKKSLQVGNLSPRGLKNLRFWNHPFVRLSRRKLKGLRFWSYPSMSQQ